MNDKILVKPTKKVCYGYQSSGFSGLVHFFLNVFLNGEGFLFETQIMTTTAESLNRNRACLTWKPDG